MMALCEIRSAAAIYRVVKFWALYSARGQSLSEPHGAATFRNILDYVVSDNQERQSRKLGRFIFLRIP